MTNKQVCQKFAAGMTGQSNTMRSERTENGTLVLYSYTTPIAYIEAGDTMATFDPRTYSVTTAKQINMAKAAVGEDNYYAIASHGAFRQGCRELGISVAMAR